MIHLDRQNGRVQILDGRLYYSPNSQDTVNVPPLPELDESQLNIFLPIPKLGRRNLFDMDIKNYQEPCWWTRPWGWISFFPHQPNFHNAAFECLLQVPRRACATDNRSFIIPADISSSWFQLDENLSRATSLLQAYYDIPAIRPFNPWAFGYHKRRKKEHILLKAMHKARDWFVVWMALFSFMIAKAQWTEMSLEGYPHLTKTNWYTYLADHGIERTWLDAIIRSIVCSFDLSTPRSGVFLHLPAQDNSQPSVEWFCHFGIPVWYFWDQDQACNPRLSYLAPLTHQLQLGTSFLAKSPSPFIEHNQAEGPFPSIIDTPNNSEQRSDSATDQVANTWQMFFARRAEMNIKALETETPADRQQRLSRERKPPTKSAKVFRWVKDIDTGQLVRESVSAKWRQDTLGNYSGKQCRYDSFANEWDCCTAFGSDDGYSTDDHDDIYFDYTEAIQDSSKPQHSPPRISNPHEHDQDWVPSSSISAYVPTLDAFEEEVVETITIHFGYTPPLPVPSDLFPPLREVERRRNALKLVGFSWDNALAGVFDRPRVLAGIDFLRKLCAKAHITSDEWDLSRSHRAHVAFSYRFSALRELQVESGSLYMFDFKSHRTVKWNLTMTTAAHALMLCRMDPLMNEVSLCLYLVRMGIPFRTLQSSETLTRSHLKVDHKALIVPNRPPGYVFTIWDYVAYFDQCRQILRGVRSRAALMRGGHVWRASITTVSLDSVAMGPSGWSTNAEEMFIVKLPETGEEYIDDELTESEAHLLCGLYNCSTGHGDQIALKSWSPLPSTYNGSGLDYGRWTSINEDLYIIAATDVEFDKELKKQPCTAKKWRNICRGLGDLRKAIQKLEEDARLLIRARNI